MTGVAYTKAALQGLGMDSYTSAALRGFGDETYTNAALRGFGDETYTNAALRGFGDETYTNAALRGMGKLKKNSPEAKAFMKHLRSMRGVKNAGKKNMEGGVAFTTIAAALGLIPTAIKGAHAIYKWIKGDGRIKGGRNVYLDPIARNEYINNEIDGKYSGLTKSRKMPYRIGPLATKVYNSRMKRIPKSVRDYLSYNQEAIDDIIANAGEMRSKIRGVQSTLDNNKPQHKVFSSQKEKKSSTTRSRRTKKRLPRIQWDEEDIDDDDLPPVPGENPRFS